MKIFSEETIRALKEIEGVLQVVEVFPDHSDPALKSMLVIYVDKNPEDLAQTISKMHNIEYAEKNPSRFTC